MKIKKFKNGNINMKLENSDKFYYSENTLNYDIALKQPMNQINIDAIYNEVIIMNDLYIQQINGCIYLVDFNTGLVYDIPFCNTLPSLKELLINEYNNKKPLKLYPYNKKTCKSLLQDLNNGY